MKYKADNSAHPYKLYMVKCPCTYTSLCSSNC